MATSADPPGRICQCCWLLYTTDDIYGRKTLSREMVKDEIPGTLYGLSPKGWMDQEFFDLWMDHFLHYAPPARPLLLMDGHSSHYCPSAIHIASQHQVVMMALPPNTTHLAQPLDKGIFGPFKVEWRKLCHEYIIANPGKVVTHHCFSELFAKAWMRSMTMKNILASFRTCGVYPIDRNKVMSHVELPSLPKPKAGGLHTFLCSHLLLAIEVIRLSVLSLHFLMLNLSCTMSD